MLQKKVNAIPYACAILPLPLSDDGDRLFFGQDGLREGPCFVKSRAVLGCVRNRANLIVPGAEGQAALYRQCAE